MERSDKKLQPSGWRVSLSIIVGVVWLAFLLIWFFFYTDKYYWEQHVAIVLLSLLMLVIVLGIPWILWWLKNQSPQEIAMWKTQGFKWRIWVSFILGFFILIFLIYWFWFLAPPYRWYQNLIIFIVALLIIGGVMGAMWAPWGMKHGKNFDESCKEKKED